MQVREATEDDADDIRSVAERSLEASYSLSPAAIRGAVEEWYGDDELAAKFDDPNRLFLVAVIEDDVVGFAESELVDRQGDILWLHVSPAHRGEGIGDDLYGATDEALRERGADLIRGMVLEDNAEGNDFYEAHGLQKAGEREVDIDGEPHRENVYATRELGELEAVATADGSQVFVDYDESTRGDENVFYVVYSDPDRERKWGYFCANCENLVTTMNSMGRLECGECGNVSKPTRWDAAYM